jgi:hypothetical protein
MKMKIEMMEMETEILFGLFLIDSNLVLRQETGGSRNRNATLTDRFLRDFFYGLTCFFQSLLPMMCPYGSSVRM